MSDDPRHQSREGSISHTYDANGNLQWTGETHTWTDCGISAAGQHALDNLPQGSLTASFDESATIPPPPSTAEVLALIQRAYGLKDEWMPELPTGRYSFDDWPSSYSFETDAAAFKRSWVHTGDWGHKPAETALEPLDLGDTDTDQYEAGAGRWKTILAVLGIVVVGVAVIVGFAAAAIFYGAGRWW